MSMTTVANPRTTRTPPPAATTSTTTTTTNQTMASNPYPLTPAPPYERRGDRAGPVRPGPLPTLGIVAMPAAAARPTFTKSRAIGDLRDSPGPHAETS